MENPLSVISLDRSAVRALQSFMKNQDSRKVIRVDLSFKGCCDPSLELSLGSRTDQDLCCSQDGLTLVMSPETHDVAGAVTVSYVDEAGRTGFIISSSKPISEWDGFGICQIRS